MTAYNSAHETYGKIAQMVKTPKRIEYEVFAKITHKLKETAVRKNRAYPNFVEALYQNRKLWTLLATDVSDRDNGLDDTLRGQILYLAEFTHLYTSRVLSEKLSVRPLLDINSAILRGLKDA